MTDLSILFWIFVGLASIVSAAFASHGHVESWSVVAAALALYLHQLRIPGDSLWPRVASALKAKLIEFLVIACAVLLLYGVLEWQLSQLALDSTTLDVISGWEKRVREVHEGLERLKLGWQALVGLLVLIYALRIMAQVNTRFARLEIRASADMALAVRWFARISTAFALAASLTFLATAEGAQGPVGRIGLKLADARKEYEEFQRTLDARIDSEARAQLLSRAWTARPMLMIQGMTEFSQINETRKAIEAQIVNHNASLDLLGVPDSSYKTSQPADDRGVSDDVPDGHWTPNELRTANETAKHLPGGAFRPGAEVEDTSIDEIAIELFKSLPAAQALFSPSAVRAITNHYPVFGEFIDAVASGLTESLYHEFRDRTRKSLTESCARNCADLQTRLARATAEEAASIPLDLSRFDHHWAKGNQSILNDWRNALKGARMRTEDVAKNGDVQQRETVVTNLTKETHLLEKAARDSSSTNLAYRASVLAFYVPRLVELSERWSVSAPDHVRQIETLRQLTADIGADISWTRGEPRPQTMYSKASAIHGYLGWEDEFQYYHVSAVPSWRLEADLHGSEVIEILGAKSITVMAQRVKTGYRLLPPRFLMLGGSLNQVLKDLETFCHQSIVVAADSIREGSPETFGASIEDGTLEPNRLEPYRKEAAKEITSALHSAGLLTPYEQWISDLSDPAKHPMDEIEREEKASRPR